MTQTVDFGAVCLQREKLTIAVAGLVDANPGCADREGVARFAEEVRYWNGVHPDMFYRDATRARSHKDALTWARSRLDQIANWHGEIFKEDL